MAYNPNNANGQATMANSAPVVIASDQSALTIASHNVTNAGTFAVQVSSISAGTNVIGKVSIDQTTPGTTNLVALAANQSVNVAQINGVTTTMGNGVSGTGVQRVTIASDSTGVIGLNAGTNTIGAVNVKPATSGGLSTFHLVSAASTNATNVKASAGQLFGWYIYNSNAAARKVAFHNTAGTPTAGASVVSAIVIPPTSAANVEFTNGIAFSTGIAITTVTDLTDAGATAVGASDLIINLYYA